MPAAAGDPLLLSHFSVFLYPFRHQLTGGRRLARLEALEPRWLPWPCRHDDADLAAALEATGFFLPYIRGLLYPETRWLRRQCPGENPVEWARTLRTLSVEGVGAYARALDADSVVRLTLRPRPLDALAAFTLQPDRSSHAAEPPLPVRCDWVDAWLFPTGLGFLLLRLRVDADAPRLAQLIRLNQLFRQVVPGSRSPLSGRVNLPGGFNCQVRDLMNDLVQGMATPWHVAEADRGGFPAPPVWPTDEPPYTDSEAGRTFGERCHLVSYACADLADCTPAELPTGPFPTPADRIVFELAACVGLGESTRNPVWTPAAEQAGRYLRENRIALWRCWTGMVLKESLVFLGTEDLPFNHSSLPRQVENDYLPLYLMALFQKLQLIGFSTELMGEVGHGHGRLRGARAILQRYVRFRSQFWFSEVTRRPQGGELYRTFQRGLDVGIAHDLVTGSIKDIKDYYEGVWSRQVGWVKDGMTYLAPPLAGLGVGHVAIRFAVSPWLAVGGLAGATAALLGLVLGLRRWRKRRRDTGRPATRTALLRAWWRKDAEPVTSR